MPGAGCYALLYCVWLRTPQVQPNMETSSEPAAMRTPEVIAPTWKTSAILVEYTDRTELLVGSPTSREVCWAPFPWWLGSTNPDTIQLFLFCFLAPSHQHQGQLLGLRQGLPSVSHQVSEPCISCGGDVAQP